MNADSIIRKLKIAKNEHELRNKRGECAKYEALIHIIETLTKLSENDKAEK